MLDDKKLCCIKFCFRTKSGKFVSELKVEANQSNISSNIFKLCWMIFLRFTFLSNINHQHQFYSSTNSYFTNSIYNRKLKMETAQPFLLVMLSELIDSDDEKPTGRKTKLWIKGKVSVDILTI